MAHVLTREELGAVEAAIADAEARTSGEIVVAVVTRSDEYALPRAIAAFALAALGASALAFAWPSLHPQWILLAQLPLALVGWGVVSLPALTRLLVSARRIDDAVGERALELFAECGVHGTRERNGVLVLVSELERRVVILGDTAIDAKIGRDGWQAHVQRIAAAIRAGKTAEGLGAVVRDLGEVLGRDFPRRADDRNELPDTVVRE